MKKATNLDATGEPSVDAASADDQQFLDGLLDACLERLGEGEDLAAPELARECPHLEGEVEEILDLARSIAIRRAPTLPIVEGHEVVRELGRGAMGSVYLARHLTLGRMVALKVLPFAALLSSRARERFQAETRALARLTHPNVVRVYEVLEREDLFAYSMEWIDGRPLSDAIALLGSKEVPKAYGEVLRLLGGEAPESEPPYVDYVVQVGIQVARALDAVHVAGLLHRDVKPSNILLRRDGTPVLSDFGLVRGDVSTLHTQTGLFVGTPAYSAPEQLRGLPDAIDARTDVYALGVTLYQALSLELPYASRSSGEILRRIEDGLRPPLERTAPEVPRDLATIVEKALSPEPVRRYATANALADDLERFAAGRPIHARPASASYRLSKLVTRHKVAFTALAVFVVSLVAFAISTAIQAAQLRVQRDGTLRFADGGRLRRLEVGADALLPALPDRIDALERWLDEAREVISRKPQHTGELARMRAALGAFDASVYIGEKARASRHPRLHEILAERESAQAAVAKAHADVVRVREHIRDLAPEMRSRQQPGRTRRSSPEDRYQLLLGATRAREADLAEIEDRLATAVWMEVNRDSEFENLADLVQRIESFERPGDGWIERVEHRLAFASTIEAATVTGPEASARWAEAIASVRVEHGLELTPQIGLLPLRRDPCSGLWEFAHLASGATPELDEHTGRWRITDETSIVLVLIPGGKLTRGATTDPAGPHYDPLAIDNEQPVRVVELAPYFLSKYEMTQGQWERHTNELPSVFDRNVGGAQRFGFGATHPVESVSWTSCARVLAQLDLMIPTEAQWEHAARGAAATPWWPGDDPTALEGAANIMDRSVHDVDDAPWPGIPEELPWDDGCVWHASVDRFLPNGYGLYGVLGNVREWCRDRQGTYADPIEPPDTLILKWTSESHAVRGGSFMGRPRDVRVTVRRFEAQEAVHPYVGVRPARRIR
ncbi:MAG: SUMF1/EgtB/PvdO family nonheme iron enzyme [bacterium]|nr:SUMF1/EgtB/PvdO family nonheme iron enzyme [bacterium]